MLTGQCQKGIAGLTEQQFAKIIIAYEPCWAIGTGKTATPEMAADAHRVIRAHLRSTFGNAAADAVRILYGGSVKPDNVKSLIASRHALCYVSAMPCYLQRTAKREDSLRNFGN